jgi:diacylglycerol O-acyltransferase 1
VQDWLRMSERVLKLSIPTLYFWLAMFVALFHLWLNVVAEVTRFGDREFYRQWWNAATVAEYWKLWNMPVHKWMLRHVHYPAMRAGLSRDKALLLCFLVSAVFHEVMVGVPLRMLRFWSFWGILGQVPLAFVSEWLRNRFQSDRVGNATFWVSFCFLGQPLAAILYFHDWRKLQGI